MSLGNEAAGKAARWGAQNDVWKRAKQGSTQARRGEARQGREAAHPHKHVRAPHTTNTPHPIKNPSKSHTRTWHSSWMAASTRGLTLARALSASVWRLGPPPPPPRPTPPPPPSSCEVSVALYLRGTVQYGMVQAVQQAVRMAVHAACRGCGRYGGLYEKRGVRDGRGMRLDGRCWQGCLWRPWGAVQYRPGQQYRSEVQLDQLGAMQGGHAAFDAACVQLCAARWAHSTHCRQHAQSRPRARATTESGEREGQRHPPEHDQPACGGLVARYCLLDVQL